MINLCYLKVHKDSTIVYTNESMNGKVRQNHNLECISYRLR